MRNVAQTTLYLKQFVKYHTHPCRPGGANRSRRESAERREEKLLENCGSLHRRFEGKF